MSSKEFDLFATTASEVCKERREQARKEISGLIDYLKFMDEVLARPTEEDAFPIAYASTVMDKALSLFNEIARCNGAAIVRAKE